MDGRFLPADRTRPPADRGPVGSKVDPRRRYPRSLSEAGASVGSAGLPSAPELWPELAELREAIVADLSGGEGEARLPAGKRAQVDLLMRAAAVERALTEEFADRFDRSLREGHRPAPSRWRVTELLVNWMALQERLIRAVGTRRIPRKVGVGAYLEQRQQAVPGGDQQGPVPTSAPQAPQAPQDGPSAPPAGDDAQDATSPERPAGRQDSTPADPGATGPDQTDQTTTAPQRPQE